MVKELEEMISTLANYLENEITGIDKDELTVTDSNTIFAITKDSTKLAEWHKTYQFYSREEGRGKREEN